VAIVIDGSDGVQQLMNDADTQRPVGSGQFGASGALFLDRDGIINVDHGYVHRISEFQFVPGIFDLTRFWTVEVQRPIIVISNQSGIGRGYFDEAQYTELTRWMCQRFAVEGSPIARVYHCPSHPQHASGPYRRDDPWRKPAPGMILQAAADLNLDLACSVIVGDKLSDMEAGVRAGMGLCILVSNSVGEETSGPFNHKTVADLTQVLALLRSHFGARSIAPQ
jgi:D-glycero-D-manno-heptose 1,7-bisphosphate phosphatase